MEPEQGEPWPVERSYHAACCLNYGGDHPQLLVSGGLDKDVKALGDMWILDVNPLAANDPFNGHLHPPQVQALSRAH